MNGYTQGLSVVGSIPTRGKHFVEINLPFTMRQHKIDNIANFVYYGKTRYPHIHAAYITPVLDEISIQKFVMT